ncbi:MAG: TetR/AcrR family transcriptional regulator, partial [Myxococcales bacterium]|nr:TetR/AcrR family transcriptional regulator [Myxococcales bacterium]
DTRAALIDAAMAAFAEEGLDNPSLDAICERAGYTRGAFYVHFQDREDLIRAVSERYLGALVQSVTEYDESPEALLNLIDRLMGTTQAPSQVPAHQFLHACGRSDTLRELYLNTLRVVSDHVCDATQLSQARAAVRGDVDPKQLTWMLIALATGLQALNETGAPVDAKGSAQLLAQLLRR